MINMKWQIHFNAKKCEVTVKHIVKDNNNYDYRMGNETLEKCDKRKGPWTKQVELTTSPFCESTHN